MGQATLQQSHMRGVVANAIRFFARVRSDTGTNSGTSGAQRCMAGRDDGQHDDC